MKVKPLKFSEIRTVEQLRERAKLINGDFYYLSVGNALSYARPFLERTGHPDDYVRVNYTAGSGSHTLTRYFKRPEQPVEGSSTETRAS